MTKCRTCGRVHTAKRGCTAKRSWKYKTGKVKGGFGETDFSKKTITIDKKKHKRGAKVGHLTKNKDGSENMMTSIMHEEMHKRHPKKSEKAVEKLARAMKSRMSPKQKKRMYAKFKG